MAQRDARQPHDLGSPWLVSRSWDSWMFGGSAAAAFALLLWGQTASLLDAGTPPWLFLGAVVFVDVAHVWATAYRVYLDPVERARRPGLYLGIPLACWVGGVVLHSLSAALFWRVLAYLAVFHFVRQQYGWVALYRRRLGETGRLDRLLDTAVIYSATVYPLLFWHANLPREFAWFLEGDFLPGLPAGAASALLPVHLGISLSWIGRQLQLLSQGRPVSAGKALVVTTTWATWFVGIVVLDSDFAFTVTNVLVHGVPYLGFVWAYGRRRYAGSDLGVARVFRPRAWPLYLAPLLAVAFFEEWAWDRAVWHEHATLFPGPELLPGPEWLALLVPLLAVPQASHYLLDAWIWRVRPGDEGLERHMGFG